MTTNEGRCEPPPEWRDRDGWHWIAKDGAKPLALHWQPNRAGQDSEWGLGYFSPSAAYAAGFRYVAPVTPPATVTALVEALENLHYEAGYLIKQLAARGLPGASGDTVDRTMQAARAALTLYRGEAGR